MTFADSGVWTSADNHYTPMTLPTQRFGARYVAPLADNHCVLFTWATCLLVLGDIADVIRTWGRAEDACLQLIKTLATGTGLASGNGYWTRSNSEVRLLATRGTPLRIAADVHFQVTARRAAPAGRGARADRSGRERPVSGAVRRGATGPADVLGRRAARAHRAADE